MDEPGALFSLLKGVFAYFDQGINDMIESIVVVVEDDQALWFLVFKII